MEKEERNQNLKHITFTDSSLVAHLSKLFLVFFVPLVFSAQITEKEVQGYYVSKRTNSCGDSTVKYVTIELILFYDQTFTLVITKKYRGSFKRFWEMSYGDNWVLDTENKQTKLIYDKNESEVLNLSENGLTMEYNVCRFLLQRVNIPKSRIKFLNKQNNDKF